MIVYSRATTFRAPVFGDALLRLKSLCELCWLPLLIVRPLQKKKRKNCFINKARRNDNETLHATS